MVVHIVLLRLLVNITADNSVSSGGEFEFDEFNLIHDGTTVDVVEYGNLHYWCWDQSMPATGLGTYSAYIDGV